MKYRRWEIKQCDGVAADRLRERGFSFLTAAVMAARGFEAPQDAEDFLCADIGILRDPMLLRDMDRAVARIKEAIAHGEHMAVYGDYDVDGITSVCVMVKFLTAAGARCDWYIPDRIKEGYGVNAPALRALRDDGVDLVITVDCGITAVDEIEYAKSIGLDVVVTDHHECKGRLPDACAVVNPFRPDCGYPFKSLAGVGVVFKLACALSPDRDVQSLLAEFSDLVSIGTVADVMPVTDENRAIIAHGIKSIISTKNPGLRHLLREAGVEDRRMTTMIIGFAIAPRVNAAGRMGQVSKAVELFLTGDEHRAAALAAELCQLNRDRQKIENEIYLQAVEQIEACGIEDNKSAIVLANPDWHHGVVGVVASKLADRYNMPSMLICLDGDVGKGSARGVKGINLCSAFESCSHLLINYGGHELAAGFSIKKEKLDAFGAAIEDYVSSRRTDEDAVSTLSIDCVIGPRDVTMSGADDLQALEPYGPGNPQPVFCMQDVLLTELTPIGGGRHVRMKVAKAGMELGAISFGAEAETFPFYEGDEVDMAFFVDINTFRNERAVQLVVRDMRLAAKDMQSQSQQVENYDLFCSGDADCGDMALMVPGRDEFVAVWRHLKSAATGGKLKGDIYKIARAIMREAGVTYAKTRICLDVFRECGLLSYAISKGVITMTINEFEGKADLSKSDILAGLRRTQRREENAGAI